ncbi:Carnitine monooxygenase reductase subunit [Paraburkholderia ultramafica]|uniref:Carnitine monooxygenase reductase subunit n=1 Tax=Paraburkholderia ultramafica TaxID=1544867 RepID=A0A6S7B5L3_9BURK|nr:ferric reductase-like transmembrane domain-containing protein [Paraburkholderia ultramafica]CAB3787893.1 Carnitine monooxygenase reductase subunit [Paraburkholderia ultramafica]
MTKNIKLAYLVLLTGLALLWLFADDVLSRPYEFRAFQLSMINFTGILTLGCMSAGMFLAIRPISVEPFLGGLDKSYRLHKWLGISTLALSTIHWLWVKAPNWLIGLGWMQRPSRRLDLSSGETLPAIVRILSSQRGLAESIGEWAFYAAVALIIVALLKRFPYRYFFKTHRLLAVAYLALAFHSVVLTKPAYWNAAIAPVMGLLMLVAAMAAAISLLRRVGHTRRAVGVIENLIHHRNNRVLGIVIKLKDRWLGHAAGQFAFVTFDPAEGPHPFTISSAWHDDGKLRFHIKGIGDYTERLPETLKPGDLVTVEGPYGTFDFRSGKPRQVWIAGGIGITPFLARMQARVRDQDERAVDLFYSTNAPDQAFIDAVEQLATRGNVRLHVLVSGKDERLTAKRLCEIVPEWMSADVWFCGAAGFGRTLRRDLAARGLHQELFDMR